MRKAPPFPGPPPWWPNPATPFVIIGGAIVIAGFTGYPLSYGSLAGSLLTIALTLACRWRSHRWMRRHKAYSEWLRAEFEAGRVEINIIVEREF